MIEYAKTPVPTDKIYVGGILATLMAEELEATTGIRPLTGLLTSSHSLGFNENVNIDRTAPDYSILDNIEYTYPDHDAYFLSFTKGCGMKCSFCAVNTIPHKQIFSYKFELKYVAITTIMYLSLSSLR